ncbi:ketoacyl reductase [Streptomyces mashuensis]|uniref:Ketoacyl reductase n=1 Tax=Streptomyces mashuensis TaxID=33904 RepID=A0A919EFF5_9ACTN|nr:SDR family NAD(P)-dependent oxidoreductase [Streptomyces mashuensis]GHF64848.1 ketoacyl reductase [Streptomyces mashuensis]
MGVHREDRLEGQAALVTGSSRGLGLLTARELARRGCAVMLCARDAAELARAERFVGEAGGRVASVAADLTAPDAARRVVDATKDAFGSLDVLVNNAGLIQVGPLGATTEDDFRSAMELMYFAPLRLTLAALEGMRERGRGRIVNVSSIGGRIPAPHLLPYDAAKFAAAGLSEGLRAELAREGISVTTVLPGLMRTGSHTAARFSGQAEREYAWFATAAALPLLSMDAERAARAIVRAAERRRPELVLTVPAKAAVRLHGVAPATTTRVLSVAARLLPGPGEEPQRLVPGHVAARRAASPVLGRLTVLNDRAARRYNQHAA